jgi:hypothetical protein
MKIYFDVIDGSMNFVDKCSNCPYYREGNFRGDDPDQCRLIPRYFSDNESWTEPEMVFPTWCPLEDQ